MNADSGLTLVVACVLLPVTPVCHSKAIHLIKNALKT